MKRLLCILSGMNIGGAETFLMKVYRHLDRTRYQMDFCINHAERQAYEDEIVTLGGRLFRVPSKSADLKGFKSALFDVISRNDYKYVLRVTSNAMGFLDLKIAHKAGACVCAVRTSSAGGDVRVKEKIAHRVGRVLYGRYVNCKIAPSDLAAVHTFGHRSYAAGEVHMIRNAVDLDLFRYDAVGALRVRREFGIPADGHVVGHVGRLDAEKNHRYLFRVFSELLKQDETAWLLLAGKGSLERELRSYANELGIGDRVVFAGVRQDIPALMSSMDAFVFPSLYEGMPNTVIEAQATGLPCVVADTITREATVAGDVKFLPLTESVSEWVCAVQKAFTLQRLNPTSEFMRQGYEICSVVREFEKIIFERDGRAC